MAELVRQGTANPRTLVQVPLSGMYFTGRGGMADALGLGPSGFTPVGVQVPPSGFSI